MNYKKGWGDINSKELLNKNGLKGGVKMSKFKDCKAFFRCYNIGMRRRCDVRRKWFYVLGILSCLVFVGSPTRAYSIAKHPELEKGKRFTPCRDCHREVTPKIYKEWYNSRHGVANVRCFQCHGSIEEFRPIPRVSTCASCHRKEIKGLKVKKVGGKPCWSCHPVHSFSAHKM